MKFDTTDTNETDEETRTRLFPITRRRVMQSLGAAGVLGGITGTATATNGDCTCEGLGGQGSRCFLPDEDCSFCKIDDSDLSVGETCTVPETSITVTRESLDCISWTDPAGELEDIALKAGNIAEENYDNPVDDVACTLYSEFGVDSNGQLCTEDGKDISHITVKHSCGDGNGGGNGGTCDPTLSSSADCEDVTVEASGLDYCSITAMVSFDNCGSETYPISNGTNTLAVPCYCTPSSISFTDSNGADLSGFDETFSVADCTPTFEAEFSCDEVEVSGTGLLDSCPVTAKLYTKADSEGYPGFNPSCGGPYTHSLTKGSPSYTFSLPCGCEADKVEFEYDGTVLDTKTASDLNCICNQIEDACKFEWYDDEQNEIVFDQWLDCNGGQIKFTNPTYKEGEEGELVCFDFESDFPVFEVFVKGGGGKDAGNTYTWLCGTTGSGTAPSLVEGPQGATWGGSLCANKHPKNGKQTAVSHVVFRVCTEEGFGTAPTNG
ncbi:MULTISPECIES: hypothetical protein [Haloferax]|uniref:Uncharacterized protein n=2 Tax=Haloferax TaxID=2251 RepID=A0A6G1Z368_9EURY|nr:MULTISPECIES: hypothetical protein [Haloferax]KAB1188242.1 hypothetical protein Hfx1149_09440 [Haloferax sp. CBA1149]MRW80925.1 hypothetical protein [Haloferax marinisediminis]